MANRYLRLRAQWDELGIEPECSLTDIARELNLSHERVKQIEVKALEKLCRGLLERGYTVADLLDLARPRQEVRS